MKEVSIKFVGFWPSFDFYNNNFTKALESKFKIRIIDSGSSESPDLLFYSINSKEHYNYPDSIKIYYTGENDVPDFNECDYAISFHNIDFNGRHLRYPLYMTYEIEEAINPPSISDEAALNRGFCSLLMKIGQNNDPRRFQIIDAVENYKPITYGGPFRNNICGNVPIGEKIEFISDFKFNLALENSSVPGYVTEKIVEAFAAPTVPIYWGAPDVTKDFNPESFINIADYQTLDSFITDLKDIDGDRDKYLSILRATRSHNDIKTDFNSRLSDYLCGIVENGKIFCPGFTYTHKLNDRNRILHTLFNRPRLLRILDKLI